MAHQCLARGTSCKYPSPGPFANCWSRTACRVWQNGPSAERQQRPHRRPAVKNARPRSPRGGEDEGKEEQEHERGRFSPVMGVQGGVVRRYLLPQRVPVRPRQRHHLHSRPCRTRRRTRSASTAAADSAADPATTAATSTAAPAAAAAGGRGGRSSAAKRGQLQQDGWWR